LSALSLQGKNTSMRHLFNFLGSMKFGLTLLLVIAVVSVIGTFLPQGKTPAFYIDKYGSSTAGLLQSLLITNLYKSFYFIGLLVLLSVSLLVCVIKRLRFIIDLFRFPKSFAGKKAVQAMNEQAQTGGGDLKPTASLLRRHHYSVTLVKKGSDGQIVAHKGRIGRVGALIVHISFILIVLGGIVGSFGYKQLLVIFEGEGVYLPRNLSDNLILYVDRIDEVRDPNSGMVSAYITSARLVKAEELVEDGDIEVNHPLEYQGINIFQEQMGITNGLSLSVLPCLGASEEYEQSILHNHTYAPEMEFPFPGSDRRAILHIQTGLGTSEDYQSPSPKVSDTTSKVILEVEDEQYVLPPKEKVSITVAGKSFLVTLNGIEEGQYTGLTASRDPGLPFFFTGAILLSIGTVVMVLFNHKQIRVLKEGEKMDIGGTAHRGKDLFSKEFAGLCQEISSNKPIHREKR